MNKKKIAIFALLSVFVIGMAMSSVCAASTTMCLKKNAMTSKKTSNTDKIYSYYGTKNTKAYLKGVTVVAMNNKKGWVKHTAMSKVKIYYKNNKNKKVLTQTQKTYDNSAYFKPKKGYTPYKVTAYYKNLKKVPAPF